MCGHVWHFMVHKEHGDACMELRQAAQRALAAVVVGRFRRRALVSGGTFVNYRCTKRIFVPRPYDSKHRRLELARSERAHLVRGRYPISGRTFARISAVTQT